MRNKFFDVGDLITESIRNENTWGSLIAKTNINALLPPSRYVVEKLVIISRIIIAHKTLDCLCLELNRSVVLVLIR